jgi:hypothetical protein
MKNQMAMVLMLVVLVVAALFCSKIMGQCLQGHLVCLESLM